MAIVVPRLGAAAVSAGGPGDLAPLRRYVGDRAKDRPVQVPPGVLAEVPIASGDDVLGCVLLLGDPAAVLDARGDRVPPPRRRSRR